MKIKYVLVLMLLFIIAAAITELNHSLEETNKIKKEQRRSYDYETVRNAPAPEVKTITIKVERSHSGSYVAGSDKYYHNSVLDK